MRKLLNTVYVTSPDAYLTRDGENVVIRVADKEQARVPVHIIESIVTFGYSGASPSLMNLCAERGVTLSFLNPHGKFLARMEGPVSGNVLLRRRQYRLADDPLFSAKIASAFVTGKVANCRTILQRALRDHKDKIATAELSPIIDRMANQLKRLQTQEELDRVRGIEGEAAQAYFSCFSHMVLEAKEDFLIMGRNRRPPRDNMNALLSYLYTLLVHECRSALESVGLDPAVGYLHRDRPGRPSLALDLMEEFRPVVADRLAISLVNRKQITAEGFTKTDTGGVVMNKETQKIVLAAWQNRKQEEIIHPFLEERISFGLLPYAQALLLARFIRGDIDGYPPFIWR